MSKTLRPTQQTGCVEATVCLDSEFEQSPLTKTQDRVCAPVTACEDITVTPATATSDAVCAERPTCDEGTQFYDEASQTCKDITSCSSSQYLAEKATSTSDAKCADITVCPERTLQDATATSDAVCGERPTCNLNKQYYDEASETCKAITKCTNKQYRRVDATPTSDAQCVPYTECTGKQFTSVAPTATSDRGCQDISEACDAGSQWESAAPSASSDRECMSLTICGEGEFEQKAPTKASDRVCEKATVCQVDEEWEVTPLTTNKDRSCAAITKCEEITAEVATATSNAVCADAVTCDAETEYESSFNVCSPLTVCKDTEYVAIPASETKDRVCKPCNALCESSCSGPSPSQCDACKFASFNGVCFANCGMNETGIEGLLLGDNKQCDLHAPCDDAKCPSKSSCFEVDGGHECQCDDGYFKNKQGKCDKCKSGCFPTQYMVSPCTEDAQMVCKASTKCAINEFTLVEKTDVSDRICQKRTQCTDLEYESVKTTQTSDRVCSSITECGEGEVETVPPTKTSDRVCASSACPQGHYLSSDEECIPHTKCEDLPCAAIDANKECFFGFKFANKKYNTCDAHAGKNTDGKPWCYTSVKKMTAWGVCSCEAVEASPPTPTSDRVCEYVIPCGASEYRDELGKCKSKVASCGVGEFSTTDVIPPKCTVHTECTFDQYQVSSPTATSDRACEALTVCSDIEFQSKPPTLTSDRTCSPLTTCNYELQYEATQASPTNDRVCLKLTKCKQNQYEDIPPSVSTDRVCRPYTSCTADEIEITPPTPISDRTCVSKILCQEGEYISQKATKTTQAVCSPLTICKPPVDAPAFVPMSFKKGTTKTQVIDMAAEECDLIGAAGMCTIEQLNAYRVKDSYTEMRRGLEATGRNVYVTKTKVAKTNYGPLAAKGVYCCGGAMTEGEVEISPPGIYADRICRAPTQCTTPDEY